MHYKTVNTFSQALNLRKICTNDGDFLCHIRELKGYMVQRWYDEVEVQTQINQESNFYRWDLLNPAEKETIFVTPLVITYHSDHSHLNSVLRTYQCLIALSLELKGVLPEPPLVAYHCPPNLRNLFVRVAQRGSQEPYRVPTCANNLTARHAPTLEWVAGSTVPALMKSFGSKPPWCWTSNIVYLIECRIRYIQYIREKENALHEWLMDHWLDINHQHLDKPVARHFNLPDHSLQDLAITTIEKIHREGAALRKEKAIGYKQSDPWHPMHWI